MPKVNIFKLDSTGQQNLLVVCELINGLVEITGDEGFAHNLRENGIQSYTGNQNTLLFPSDGRLFLEQLKFNFKSGYLMATDVLEN